MSFIVEDFVRETTTTTGTGDITLAGARQPARTFSSVLADNDTFPYAISSQTGSEWEVGIGTYHSGTNTFTRTTVERSSNANAVVTFSAGTKNVDLVLSSRMVLNLSGLAVTQLIASRS